jgi:hypothetical protein
MNYRAAKPRGISPFSASYSYCAAENELSLDRKFILLHPVYYPKFVSRKSLTGGRNLDATNERHYLIFAYRRYSVKKNNGAPIVNFYNSLKKEALDQYRQRIYGASRWANRLSKKKINKRECFK